MSTTGSRPRVLAGLLAAGLALLLSALPTPASAAAPIASINLDNATDVLAPGQDVRFLVTVRNAATEPLAGASVVLTTGGAVRVGDAGGGSQVDPTHIRWSVDIAAKGEAVFTLAGTMINATTPSGKVISTACLLLAESTRPLVCSSDIDTGTATAAAPAAGSSPSFVASVAAGLGAALVLGLGYVGYRRFQRPATAAATPDREPRVRADVDA
ncbi:hypothetical protein [Actinokineospora sp.]|uniref:hypothetical protein n=1 Tax=Actinokineospora sp. TaxID=1872133 RepID=UPI0040378ADE